MEGWNSFCTQLVCPMFFSKLGKNSGKTPEKLRKNSGKLIIFFLISERNQVLGSVRACLFRDILFVLFRLVPVTPGTLAVFHLCHVESKDNSPPEGTQGPEGTTPTA